MNECYARGKTKVDYKNWDFTREKHMRNFSKYTVLFTSPIGRFFFINKKGKIIV